MFHFLIIGLLFSWSSHSSKLLFSCLELRNYTCLKNELDLDQKWSTRLNEHQQTPLLYAIEARDPGLLRFLVRRGAQVEREHLSLALKHFFNQDSAIRERPAEEFAGDLTKVERMLLAAARDNKDDLQIKLSKIIGLFAGKEEIAHSIKNLFVNNLIDERKTNIYLREFDNLFLQDKVLNLDELFEVIDILSPLGVEKFILLLICEAYKLSNSKHSFADTISVEDSIGAGAIEKNLAYAIIEKSRRLFLSLPPEQLLNEIKNPDKSVVLKNAIEESTKLTKFIEMTIKYPEQGLSVDRNYRTWLRVHGMIVDQGDFMSAFAVGTALNQSSIQRLVDEKIYEEIQLLNPESSFKNYRIQLSLFDRKFSIPSLMIIMKDVIHVNELDPLTDAEPFEILNNNALKYYTKLRKSLSIPYRLAKKRSYQAAPNFQELINNLDFKEGDFATKEWKHAYRMLWPAKKNRSFSMRFDARSFVHGRQDPQALPPKKAGTPRKKMKSYFYD
jgi:hypothetical protein